MFIGKKTHFMQIPFQQAYDFNFDCMAVGSASHFQSVPFTIELGSGKVNLCGKSLSVT